MWVELPGKHAQRLLNVIASEDTELRANILGLVPLEADTPKASYAYQAAYGWRFQVMPIHQAGDDCVWLSVGVGSRKTNSPLSSLRLSDPRRWHRCRRC